MLRGWQEGADGVKGFTKQQLAGFSALANQQAGVDPEPPIRGNIIAIDPGTTESAILIWRDGGVDPNSKFMPNHEIEALLTAASGLKDMDLVIEGMQGYGKPVGKETFETCIWIGRFIRSWLILNASYHLMYRPKIKTILCGTVKAKDKDVRAALISMFPATGGGTAPQIGTKELPGPLYNVTGHLWSALSLAACHSSHPTAPLA